MALVVAWLTQGILGAVLSHFVGTQDPQQVNMLAKQAGEVSYIKFGYSYIHA